MPDFKGNIIEGRISHCNVGRVLHNRIELVRRRIARGPFGVVSYIRLIY